LRFELGRVALINHQAVVVEQLCASLQILQGFDEHAAAHFVGFAVGRAAVVDPACIVAAVLGVNAAAVFQRKVKSVIRVCRVVRVAIERFLPVNHFALVFNEHFACGDVLQGVHAFAVYARGPHANAFAQTPGNDGHRLHSFRLQIKFLGFDTISRHGG
jgi:hypothetical protein